jgi:hypothetical protein
LPLIVIHRLIWVIEDFDAVKNAFLVTSNGSLRTDICRYRFRCSNALDVGDTGTFNVVVENESAAAFGDATAQISSNCTFSSCGTLNYNITALEQCFGQCEFNVK